MKKKPISLLLTLLILSFFTVTDAFSLTFYVDASTGNDNHSWGVKPDKPWKTITYAVQQTSIIEAYEEVLIKIAPGTYNESVTIDTRQVSLEGTGADIIIDGGDQNVITIDGASGVVITGVIVQNGKKGIIGKNGAAFTVIETIITDNTNDGIQVVGNSTALLIQCTVQDSDDDGIEVSRNSSVFCMNTINVNDNGSDGFAVGSTSSVFFYDAIVTIEDNGRRGVLTDQSSSLIFNYSTATIQNNTDDGVGIFGSSSLTFVNNANIIIMGNKDDGISVNESSSLSFAYGTTLLIKDNKQRGLVAGTNSNISISSGSKLTICENRSFGIHAEESSNVTINGTVDIEANGDIGAFVTDSANLRINSSAEVTVKDTTGYATGIKVREGSSMLAWGAKLEIKDNKGIDGVGIMVLRNSHVRLAGAGLDAKIFNNDGHGVEIGQNSSGRFDLGTKIYSNRNDGMNINSNSMFYAQGIEVTGNDGRGIAADDGSSVGCNSCTICGNTVDSVALTFGSRGSFYEPKNCPPIPEANCDETVLIRGDIICSFL